MCEVPWKLDCNQRRGLQAYEDWCVIFFNGFNFFDYQLSTFL